MGAGGNTTWGGVANSRLFKYGELTERMDFGGDGYFVEISFTPVVHKALELEKALRTCRANVETGEER